MITPDTALLKAFVDDALASVGIVQRPDGTIDSTLSKVDEAERRISRAHAAIVGFQCEARGQSRRER